MTQKESREQAQKFVDKLLQQGLIVKKVKVYCPNFGYLWHSVHNGKVLKAPIPMLKGD